MNYEKEGMGKGLYTFTACCSHGGYVIIDTEQARVVTLQRFTDELFLQRQHMFDCKTDRFTYANPTQSSIVVDKMAGQHADSPSALYGQHRMNRHLQGDFWYPGVQLFSEHPFCACDTFVRRNSCPKD
jgi:hypothetical protein